MLHRKTFETQMVTYTFRRSAYSGKEKRRKGYATIMLQENSVFRSFSEQLYRSSTLTCSVIAMTCNVINSDVATKLTKPDLESVVIQPTNHCTDALLPLFKNL